MLGAMPNMGTRTEVWRIDEVRRYLRKEFVTRRIDDYPRGGNVAHLFLVAESRIGGQRPTTHQLLVTRQFLHRFTDHTALHEALADADVAKQLERAGERTIELY